MKKKPQKTDKGLLALHTELVRAFDWWNARRFRGRLSPVIIGFHPQPSNGSEARLGHYLAGAWTAGAKDKSKKLPEIVFYADLCLAAGVQEILLTLVHEMVHHRQHEQGVPGRRVHNREWHGMASDAGLRTEGPKGLGPGGSGSDAGPLFLADVAAFKFRVDEIPFRQLFGKRKRKKGKMRRWSCPMECNGSIRAGKTEVYLVCGVCGEDLTPDEDLDEEEDDDELRVAARGR